MRAKSWSRGRWGSLRLQSSRREETPCRLGDEDWGGGHSRGKEGMVSVGIFARPFSWLSMRKVEHGDPLIHHDQIHSPSK